MSFFVSKIKSIFGSPAAEKAGSVAVEKSRSIARERLSVILASQRGSEILTGLNREQLQKDVMEVVQRHLNDVQARSPQFQVRQDGDVSMFEMQVEIVPRKR
mmetsp:Transcript_2272/g.3114  ORF Transcript_2272/g.3114 Transcript_2272/m.3114 type:complete len:102 (-) Transcript_2272:321-626(-)|eukprot:CAMPEP_0116064186 /NCGR_PEP_ID=MMETSP0322-20121206/8931_1 /TAXON_ID=163516 /ORGANISM="Leptocylindrus danicus var. apora, Strain B651" /LENGTH=101 /DNA_ID=CAMNT_0003550089 /DNA_START=53 /DNA_END=358 /DNA_ORIENTATION=+